MKLLGELIQGTIVIGRVAYLYRRNRKPRYPMGISSSSPARMTRKQAFLRALDGQ